MFLDGSGGPFASDHRIRVCGWAWVQVEIDSTGATPKTLAQWGQRGTVPGRQTVPRAETIALLCFMQAVDQAILAGKQFDVG